MTSPAAAHRNRHHLPHGDLTEATEASYPQNENLHLIETKL
jgi:hypothetical protein